MSLSDLKPNIVYYRDLECTQGHVSIEEFQDRFYIHCELEHWSVSLYKKALEEWLQILDELAAMGIDKVYGYRVDEKQAGFMSMFGFTETDDFLIMSRGDMRVLYCYQIED